MATRSIISGATVVDGPERALAPVRRHRGAGTPPAIVIGVDSLQGLQAARILTARGIRVIGVAKNPKHHACRTRACEKILIADTGGSGLVDLLTDLGPSFDSEPVLFPCQDKNVIVLSRHRASLESWYRIMLPPGDVVEMMIDKSTFYEWARCHGFPIPSTFVLRDRADAEIAAAELVYPAILKPPVRLREWSRHTREKAVIVADESEFLTEYDRFSPWAESLIVQELIQGPVTNQFTVNAYFGAGSQPLASVTTQKLRQWPVGTGQACLSQSVENEVVTREAFRLFGSVDYRGLGYLEMKLDDRTGEYLIVEPNIGRPTGRSATAEAVGVELLATMYCDAVGLARPESPEPKRAGVKWLNLARDCQLSIQQIRRRELTLREWFRSVRGPRIYAIFSLRDPLPFLVATGGTVVQIISGTALFRRAAKLLGRRTR